VYRCQVRRCGYMARAKEGTVITCPYHVGRAPQVQFKAWVPVAEVDTTISIDRSNQRP
jgi:hypothetical protein